MDAPTFDLLLWLRERRLTIEDITSTFEDECRERGPLFPGEVVAAAREHHGLDAADDPRLTEVLRFALLAEDLDECPDGRIKAIGDKQERITALVSVPPDMWETIKPYVTTNRAAWVLPA